ncbi:MAG: OHCU decarboxylase [Acidobacteria bacterium 13_1_20CM_3_53_8]|nr:MAG: OHCU decarboxylase [Acidobacteria bacterium 13_1_20CM_3_53_8]
MIERLNKLARVEAEAEFLKCCGSVKWAEEMASARPFEDFQELLVKADSTWWGLDEIDWLEAFSHHPKIGERKAALAQDAQARAWSSEEQSGTRKSSEELLTEMAELNHSYERKFGYIYIVCASGKTTEEMLENLRERLRNDPQTEIRIAAEEQRKITQLRLKKLLESLETE